MARPLARLASLLTALDLAPSIVLEVGCGAWDSLPVLRAAYPSARLIGVDIRPLSEQVTDPRAVFVQANLTTLPLALRADLLLVRHPDIVRSRAAWEPFLRDPSACLAQNGVLLVTTYSAEEAALIRAYLPRWSLITIVPFMLDPPDQVGRDRYFFALRNGRI